MRFRITPGFMVVWSVFFYLDRQNIVPLVLLSAGIHEFAHWQTVRLCGGGISRFHLTATGGNMILDAGKPLSSSCELLAIAMGPLSNIILSVVTAQFGEYWHVFSGLNLALGLFNLLPIYPLDGGRILKLIVMNRVPIAHGYTVFTWCTDAARIILLIGVVFCWYMCGVHISLVIMSVWLIAGIKHRNFT